MISFFTPRLHAAALPTVVAVIVSVFVSCASPSAERTAATDPPSGALASVSSAPVASAEPPRRRSPERAATPGPSGAGSLEGAPPVPLVPAPLPSAAPSPYPDRIVLTWSQDPSSSLSVSWRTDTSVRESVAQIAVAKAEPSFSRTARTVSANTETFPSHRLAGETVEAHYHTVTFEGLEPGMQYAYRVGDGTHWSEWFHARTGSAEADPFSFIYFGDAQNGIRSHWSRAIRAAYTRAPEAAFLVHAGDLVDRAHRNVEWGQWSAAGGWVQSMRPNIAVPGNHEYDAVGDARMVEQTLALKATRADDDSRLTGAVVLPGGDEVPFEATRDEEAGDAWVGTWSYQIAGSAYQGTLQLTGSSGALGGALVDDTGTRRDLRDLSVAGNRLEASFSIEMPQEGQQELSLHWRPQFALPENGPKGMEETVYYLDYQGMRVIALNSNLRDSTRLRRQTEWLSSVLEDTDARWVVATFHHPLFSSSQGRDNPALREAWKPLFDKHQVDLVMQGHDHTYARGHAQNLAQGVNARTPRSGTVYVNSVSGAKMYEIKDDRWQRFDDVEMQRGAENTQLFQVVHVERDTMKYRSYTVTGDLYDAFDLVKRPGDAPNELIERPTDVPAERTHENTVAYE